MNRHPLGFNDSKFTGLINGQMPSLNQSSQAKGSFSGENELAKGSNINQF